MCGFLMVKSLNGWDFSKLNWKVRQAADGGNEDYAIGSNIENDHTDDS